MHQIIGMTGITNPEIKRMQSSKAGQTEISFYTDKRKIPERRRLGFSVFVFWIFNRELYIVCYSDDQDILVLVHLFKVQEKLAKHGENVDLDADLSGSLKSLYRDLLGVFSLNRK